MLTRLRNHLARPLVAEMRLTLASMARSLSRADAEIASLTAERDSLLADMRDDEGYNNILDESIEVCHILGIDTLADYDMRTTARAVVAERDTLHAQLAALTPKPRAVVPEERRMAVVRTVAGYESVGHVPTAITIADYMGDHEGHVDAPASIARWVSDVAAEGWIASNGKRPARYSLTAKGRDALTPSGVAVAS